MRQPNTTFDLFLDGSIPPAAADTSGLTGYLKDRFDQGQEASEGNNQTFRWTATMEVPLGISLPDGYPAGNFKTTVWVPDSTGTCYTVVFVERERGFRGDDFLRVYLKKEQDVAVTIRKNSGANVGTRGRLNLIEGSNITLTVADDSTDKEVDITIAAASGAPADAQYIVVALNGTLTAERRLQATKPLKIADGGANSDITLSLEEGLDSGQTIPVGPFWLKVTKTFADFAVADVNNEVEIYSLPARGVVHGIICKTTTAFAGTGITDYRLTAGVSGNSTCFNIQDGFGGTYNLDATVANDHIGQAFGVSGSLPWCFNFGSATSIVATVSSIGANLDQATQGSVDIYLLLSKLP